jgi:hypothetical protein
VAFIEGVIQSLVANVISAIYKDKNVSNSKQRFEDRASLYYKKILPYLMDIVIPELADDLSIKLNKEYIRDVEVKCPYVNLIDGSNLAIPKNLQTNRNHFNVNDDFIRWLREDLEKVANNDPTFCLNSISTDNRLSISVGNYFSTLSTSDVHYYNLIRDFPINSRLGTYYAYKYGKHVREWISSLKKIINKKSFSHYCASIGCSVFTVLRYPDGDYKYLIKTNSPQKNSAYDRHVIPSFMFQPTSNTINEQEAEMNLALNVIKEYGEELLSIDELDEATSQTVVNRIISDNPLLFALREGLRQKKFKLLITGLILDVVRLRPEITLLLIIDDEEFSQQIKPNWEVERKTLDVFDLFDETVYEEVLLDRDKPLCSPGIAAVVNGRSKALELLAKNA